LFCKQFAHLITKSNSNLLFFSITRPQTFAMCWTWAAAGSANHMVNTGKIRVRTRWSIRKERSFELSQSQNYHTLSVFYL